MARLFYWTTCLVAIIFFMSGSCTASRLNGSRSIFNYPERAPADEKEEEEGSGELGTFQQVESKMRGMIDDVIKKVLPYVIRSSADIRLSGRCMASIFKLVLGMQKLQEWAVRMVDATGKPPSGLFQGTSMSLGDFDECIAVRVGRGHREPVTAAEEAFHGKYCTVECKLPKGLMDAIDEYERTPFRERYNTSIGRSKTFLRILPRYGPYMKEAAFRFGVCIPSTCGEADLSSIVSTATKQIGFPMKVLHCQEKEKLKLNAEHKIIITVMSSIVLVILTCTAAECYFCRVAGSVPPKNRCQLHKLSVTLSAICNTKKLFKVDVDEHPMPVLRGMFLFTVVFNILGHTYLMYNHLFFFKYSSVLNYFEYMQQFSFTFIANGSNGIENYFFIAGFMMTYIRWKFPMNPPKLHLTKLLLKPYIRMCFLQLLAIGIFLLLPLVGYGPFWGDFVGPYLHNCRQRWWTNLLFIQNYWASEDACLYHTWLMAAVMQLYVISVVILWFLIKRPTIGIALVIGIIICGMATVGAIVFVKELPGALSLYLVDGISGPKMWNSLYIQTFDHVGAFCIGLLTGYALAKNQHKIKLKTVTVVLLWCISLAAILAVIFGLYEYRYGNIQMQSYLAILYAMLNRNVYGLFLAWFMVACVTDNAGVIPSILSWKALIPVYRLSFLAYLIHLIVIYYHVGVLRERVYMSHEENVINYFGYLVTTYILSYFCYVFFQVPYTFTESLVVNVVCGKQITKSYSSRNESRKEIMEDMKTRHGSVSSITARTNSFIELGMPERF